MHQSIVSIFDSKAHIDIMKHEVLRRQICRFISSLVLANSTDQHCRTSALALMIHSWLNTLATGLLKSWAVLGNRRQKALEIRLGRGREGQPPRGVHNKRWGHLHALVPVPWSPHLFFFWQTAQSKSIATSSNQTSRKRKEEGFGFSRVYSRWRPLNMAVALCRRCLPPSVSLR